MNAIAQEWYKVNLSLCFALETTIFVLCVGDFVGILAGTGDGIDRFGSWVVLVSLGGHDRSVQDLRHDRLCDRVLVLLVTVGGAQHGIRLRKISGYAGLVC